MNMENNVPVTNEEEVKKAVVNCPKCSTALSITLGNSAYLCPVCSQLFRVRVGERMVKDLTPPAVEETPAEEVAPAEDVEAKPGV